MKEGLVLCSLVKLVKFPNSLPFILLQNGYFACTVYILPLTIARGLRTMTIRPIFTLLIICNSLYLAGCGGGSSGGAVPDESARIDDPQIVIDDPAALPVEGSAPGDETVDVPEIVQESDVSPESADRARYRVTLENYWGVEDFPQEFPDDGHLSLIGGATHNTAVSFWNEGEVATRGIEDMAETGRIDELLFDEVVPAIGNGTADSIIEIRSYTAARIDGVPGVNMFEIDMQVGYPLITLVTMLGPSPDWFVGVSGLPLHSGDVWVTQLSVDLPLYDGGTKSSITPVMGGPDIIPANPVELIAYDPVQGVYLPSETAQNVARLTFELIDIVQ